MPILFQDLCDKSCFARKFAWLGKRNATIAPVQPKVSFVPYLHAVCLSPTQRGSAHLVRGRIGMAKHPVTNPSPLLCSGLLGVRS